MAELKLRENAHASSSSHAKQREKAIVYVLNLITNSILSDRLKKASNHGYTSLSHQHELVAILLRVSKKKWLKIVISCYYVNSNQFTNGSLKSKRFRSIAANINLNTTDSSHPKKQSHDMKFFGNGLQVEKVRQGPNERNSTLYLTFMQRLTSSINSLFNMWRLPFDQKFRNFRNRKKWYGNFQGKVPGNYAEPLYDSLTPCSLRRFRCRCGLCKISTVVVCKKSPRCRLISVLFASIFVI